MAEHEHVALDDTVAQIPLPDLAVQLIGDEDRHQVATASGLDDWDDFETLLAGRNGRGRTLA